MGDRFNRGYYGGNNYGGNNYGGNNYPFPPSYNNPNGITPPAAGRAGTRDPNAMPAPAMPLPAQSPYASQRQQEERNRAVLLAAALRQQGAATPSGSQLPQTQTRRGGPPHRRGFSSVEQDPGQVGASIPRIRSAVPAVSRYAPQQNAGYPPQQSYGLLPGRSYSTAQPFSPYAPPQDAGYPPQQSYGSSSDRSRSTDPYQNQRHQNQRRNFAYTGQPSIPEIEITDPENRPTASASQPTGQSNQYRSRSFLFANAGSAQQGNLYVGQQRASLLSQLSQNTVQELTPIQNYSESNARTHILVQGEACFISARSRGVMRGLFTFGAGPCSILMVTARNRTRDEPVVTGAGHIDSYVTDQALDNFFAQVANFRRVEVSVIGGCEATVEQILQAAERANARTVFVAPNLDESRVDDAAIDSQGNIYYGVKDFSDPQEPEKMIDVMTRLEAPRESNLPIEEQLRITIL